MLALLDLVSGIELKGSRLMSYASHQANTDMGNTRFQAMQGEIRSHLRADELQALLPAARYPGPGRGKIRRLS